MRTDELRALLADRAATVDDDGQPTTRDRLAGIDELVEATRRRRRATSAAGLALAVVAAIGAVAIAPSVLPDPTARTARPEPDRVNPSDDPMVQPPPEMSGFQLPGTMTVNDVPYQYLRSEETPLGRDRLLVAVAPSRQPLALAWVTPAGTRGEVRVSVDGEVVSRSRAGGMETGLLLSARRSHLVSLRVTEPGPSTRIGLAIYRWPQP